MFLRFSSSHRKWINQTCNTNLTEVGVCQLHMIPEIWDVDSMCHDSLSK